MASRSQSGRDEKKRLHVTAIAERFISEFTENPEKALAPWIEKERPVNAATGKEYGGRNIFTLNWQKEDKGFGRNSWVTFNQARSLGGAVRKGERGTQIMGAVSGKEGDNEAYRAAREKGLLPETGRPTSFVGFNLFTVFNIEQCDGISLVDVAASDANPWLRPVYSLDEILRQNSDLVIYGKDAAEVSADGTEVTYPSRAAFGVAEDNKTAERFYSGLLTLIRKAQMIQKISSDDHSFTDADLNLAAILIASHDCGRTNLGFDTQAIPSEIKSSAGEADFNQSFRLYNLMNEQ